MGLFRKQLTDDQWLKQFVPLAKRVSEQSEDVRQAFVASIGQAEISAIKGELSKLRHTAQELRQLSSPTSPATRRLKTSYDSYLGAIIERQELKAERGGIIAAWQVTATNARKLQHLEATEDRLERKIDKETDVIEEFLFEHDIHLHLS